MQTHIYLESVSEQQLLSCHSSSQADSGTEHTESTEVILIMQHATESFEYSYTMVCTMMLHVQKPMLSPWCLAKTFFFFVSATPCVGLLPGSTPWPAMAGRSLPISGVLLERLSPPPHSCDSTCRRETLHYYTQTLKDTTYI